MSVALWNVVVSNEKHLRLSVYVHSADARSMKARDVNEAKRKARARGLIKLRELDPTLKLSDITDVRCVG